MTETTRRMTLGSLAAAGLAGVATTAGLNACASGTSEGTEDSASAEGSSNAAGEAGAGTSGSSDSIKTSEIPVGGGQIFEDRKIVVTQPTAGEFKAFSSVCPHQGCAVAEITGSNIVCPCHGSTFDIETGAVTNGPATSPLSAKTVAVDGDSLTVT